MAAFDCEEPELMSKRMRRWVLAAVAAVGIASAQAQAPESPVQSAAQHHPWLIIRGYAGPHPRQHDRSQPREAL